MTREEEIINAAYNEAEVERQLKMHPQVFEQGFVAGAKWADRTMIENACEWLEDNLYELIRDQEFIGTICRYVDKKVNIEQFRKAMKGDNQ